MSLAEELCAAAPMMLVLDDLQRADDASLLVWHQLAASIDQLRLLLIATCRPTPRRPRRHERVVSEFAFHCVADVLGLAHCVASFR
jgi:predicted ATPase